MSTALERAKELVEDMCRDELEAVLVFIRSEMAMSKEERRYRTQKERDEAQRARRYAAFKARNKRP